MESWGPSMHSSDASTMNFGEFVQHTNHLNKHYWYFLIPPSGPASGSRRCWKMETWGPGVHSFEAFHMISGYFVQYASPLKIHYQYFLILPSGPASGSRRCWKMESWSPGIHSFEAFNMNLGILVNTQTLRKYIIGIFLYHPQGQLQAQEGLVIWSPVALATTVLKHWTWILEILLNILAFEKNIIGIFLYHPQGQPQVEEGVGKWSSEALASTVLTLLTWILGILLNVSALWKTVTGRLLFNPQGQHQAQEGVVILSPEALATTFLKILTWILGILFNILALWKNIIGI